MPYGTPETGESAKYTVLLRNDVGVAPDAGAVIEVSMNPEWIWTQAGLDDLFQQLLDLFDSAPFLAPIYAPLEGHKTQGVNTTVTPTP